LVEILFCTEDKDPPSSPVSASSLVSSVPNTRWALLAAFPGRGLMKLRKKATNLPFRFQTGIWDS
jgi:hypothetical protein